MPDAHELYQKFLAENFSYWDHCFLDQVSFNEQFRSYYKDNNYHKYILQNSLQKLC